MQVQRFRNDTRMKTAARLDQPAVTAFEEKLRGRLIRPGDPEYDEARQVYNGMIDKHPALIARCVDVADVMAAVNFAREQEVPLAGPRYDVRTGRLHRLVAPFG